MAILQVSASVPAKHLQLIQIESLYTVLLQVHPPQTCSFPTPQYLHIRPAPIDSSRLHDIQGQLFGQLLYSKEACPSPDLAVLWQGKVKAQVCWLSCTCAPVELLRNALLYL